MKQFRGGLVCKAHRLLRHSTLGFGVMKKMRRVRLLGSGFRGQGLGFGSQKKGSRDMGLGFCIQDLGVRGSHHFLAVERASG